MSDTTDLFIGIDIGTSGVRGVCVDSEMTCCAVSAVSFAKLSGKRTDPELWSEAVGLVLSEIVRTVPSEKIVAVSVDGTSGTMIVTDESGRAVSQAMMYNDTCKDVELLSLIKETAPTTSAAHGATSGLAKAIILTRSHACTYIQHEADWIASCLSGQVGLSDENNALKTGYDPISRTWPAWIDKTGMDSALLPRVLRAGQAIGTASGWLAKKSGLSDRVIIVAGTTDGCASLLATGASEPGDGVSILGSTLTIKILSPMPIYAPQYGIYSHRIGDTWLAGGASNTGGSVLEHYFSVDDLAELSETIDVNSDTKLDYYPLLSPGERFPINDSSLKPRLEPRPSSDTKFLQGMLEGISDIEKLAYDRLAELGSLYPRTIRTVGGGAKNSVWTAIRKKRLGVPFKPCLSEHAATGAAVLARRGAIEAGISVK